jgi:hypothetical protein
MPANDTANCPRIIRPVVHTKIMTESRELVTRQAEPPVAEAFSEHHRFRVVYANGDGH